MVKTSSSVPCAECGKVIAHIVDGNFVAVDPTGWAMTEDERELCSECLEKEKEGNVDETVNKNYDDATVLLVDSHHGIYAAQMLAKCVPLYLGDGTQAPADLVEQFDPDNSDNCDNIDHYFYNVELYVKGKTGKLWRVDWNEGDIIAVHPEADWEEERGAYYIKEKNNA